MSKQIISNVWGPDRDFDIEIEENDGRSNYIPAKDFYAAVLRSLADTFTAKDRHIEAMMVLSVARLVETLL